MFTEPLAFWSRDVLGSTLFLSLLKVVYNLNVFIFKLAAALYLTVFSHTPVRARFYLSVSCVVRKITDTEAETLIIGPHGYI